MFDDRLVSVNKDTKQLPPDVRSRFVQNFADPNEPEGAVLAEAVAEIVPGVVGEVQDPAIADLVSDPGSQTGAALYATYARFVDQDGNPLPAGTVTIVVNASNGSIDDINYSEGTD